MGFKTGVLIGVLTTAVVALGIAVVLLASDSDDGDGSATTTATTTTTSEVLGPPCQFESMGGEVEIELSSEEIGCSEARAVYSAYKEAVRSGDAAGIGESSDVAGWGCEEFPLAEYPLVVRCRQGGERFVVLGTAPAAHMNQGPPPTASSEITYFQTPSGNISCAMRTDEVRCDITERDWSAPPEPADCTLDWGHAIALDRGESTFLCAGDTVADEDNPVLPYGESVAVGSFLCESQKQNLLCVNVRTQHGFRLSIQRIDLF